MRAFFLGGVDELVSIKTAGYNDSLNKISRIGMQGVNSGTIKIKLNVILHHSHPVIKEKVKIGELRKVFYFSSSMVDGCVLENLTKCNGSVSRSKGQADNVEAKYAPI